MSEDVEVKTEMVQINYCELGTLKTVTLNVPERCGPYAMAACVVGFIEGFANRLGKNEANEKLSKESASFLESLFKPKENIDEAPQENV